MILQLGLGMLMIWLFNWILMLKEFLSYTPNWREDEVDGEKIVSNFMMNAPMERIQFIQNLAQMNPFLFIGGLVLILYGFII